MTGLPCAHWEGTQATLTEYYLTLTLQHDADSSLQGMVARLRVCAIVWESFLIIGYYVPFLRDCSWEDVCTRAWECWPWGGSTGLSTIGEAHVRSKCGYGGGSWICVFEEIVWAVFLLSSRLRHWHCGC